MWNRSLNVLHTLSGMMLCLCEHLTIPESALDAISLTSTFSSPRQSNNTSMTRVTPGLEMLSRFR